MTAEEVERVEGMEHVGWYQPSRKPGEQLWPKRLEPNDDWAQPVLPLYAPTQIDEGPGMSGDGVAQRSLVSIAADLARSAYDDRLPDDVADEMRRKALLLRNEYDKGRRVERIGTAHRTIKVCDVCGTDCPRCKQTDEPRGGS